MNHQLLVPMISKCNKFGKVTGFSTLLKISNYKDLPLWENYVRDFFMITTTIEIEVLYLS